VIVVEGTLKILKEMPQQTSFQPTGFLWDEAGPLAVFDPSSTVAKGLQAGLSNFLADSMCWILGCQEAAGSLAFE
jgi:hypothetical protein